jgi:hypothetical protein
LNGISDNRFDCIVSKKPGVLYERGCVIQQTFDYASSKPSIDGTLFWDWQWNSQKKRDRWTNNGEQNTTQKTEDWVRRTPSKPEVNSGAPEK